MKPYYEDSTIQLWHGANLDVLPHLGDGSVDCVVTSPPYFALRDYGVEGQYGAEETPAQFVANLVATFREIRRVLADDGTVWLNLGDSYSNPISYATGSAAAASSTLHTNQQRTPVGKPVRKKLDIPPKNLLGMPWMVARALQQPQYVGRIRSATDRAWLAGWIDGEGTISYTERDRGPNHSPTHDVRVFVTNCDDVPLRQFAEVCGGRVYVHDDGTRENRYGKRVVYRWQMGTHESAMVLREIYPYLRTKRKQASLIWTLFTTLRHQNGHARTPADVIAQRREIALMVRTLNTGVDVDLPKWVVEPPAPEEPGWILRNAICWHKPNAMPESVTDRLSTRYEMLFLFSKSRRYHFDLDAIKDAYTPQPGLANSFARETKEADVPGQGYRQHRKDRADARPQRARAEQLAKQHGLTDAHIAAIRSVGVTDTGKATIQTGTGKNRPEIQALADEAKAALGGYYREFLTPAGKNPGDVWSLAAEPFPGAHFATFPSELPRRCILAGCKPGGTVLDPFHGSGTTGMVAQRLGRKYVGIELNAEYIDLSLRTRLRDGVLDFEEPA